MLWYIAVYFIPGYGINCCVCFVVTCSALKMYFHASAYESYSTEVVNLLLNGNSNGELVKCFEY